MRRGRPDRGRGKGCKETGERKSEGEMGKKERSRGSGDWKQGYQAMGRGKREKGKELRNQLQPRRLYLIQKSANFLFFR